MRQILPLQIIAASYLNERLGKRKTSERLPLHLKEQFNKNQPKGNGTILPKAYDFLVSKLAQLRVIHDLPPVLRIRIRAIIRDPIQGVLGSGSISYSNEHIKINWKGKFNKECLLVGSCWNY